MNYLDILCFSIAALQLMVYKACASSLLQRPNPVPSRLSRGTGRDGTGSGRDFQNGTGLCLRCLQYVFTEMSSGVTLQ